MMSERKRKRGRPRVAPVISYEAEMKMRSNIPRIIKKPKYLRDAEEESNASRGSTPPRVFDEPSVQVPNKNSRGYNPEYDDKNSEFHYGSDFEIEGTSDNEAQDSDDGDNPCLSDVGGLLSDEEGVLSEDSHSQDLHDPSSGNVGSSPALSRPCTPEALWLQDRSLPRLNLPPSADDLLVPLEYVMPALSVYEVLRHFRSIVRLSPFRFEEFCGALLSPQQTVLLADIHIALLRAMVREDESQSTHFGPLDQKDSINVMLYLVDPVTWPQVLHSYLSSDSSGHRALVRMMDKCSYPYTSLQNRLTVLRVLTDEVLSVSGVRELLISEGKLRYDDHCRSCHKTGDLLCCDSCSAVYHINCLGADEAPSMPIDDWTCSVCSQNQVTGVTDCLSSPEASGLLSRHHPLGYDRHGRKYWFLTRRLIVESSEGSVWYYSTVRQVQAVISMLDASEYEAELVLNIEDQRHEMERQLAVTEKLTRPSAGTRTPALAQDDDVITKFVSSGGGDVKDEVKDEVKEELNKSLDSTEALGPLQVTKFDVKDEKVKDEPGEAGQQDQKQKPGLWDHSIVGRTWQLPLSAAEKVSAAKLVQLRSNGQAYRLGADCGQSYVNQYSSNPLALNKLQHNEDRDKKRQLSHKFSITSPEFKWNSTTYGGASEARECVRGSIQQLEQQISPHLYHPHWASLRKAWLASLSNDSTPRQFAKSLVTLVAAIKPVVFHSVWHDALGHLRLYRLTALEREEKRRQEKRDKKELESQALDELRNTLPVRFTKFPKHQLWKVRGEEYRASVGDGWRWCARHRRVRAADCHTMGLRAGPDKVVVGVTTESGLRGLPVTPQVFDTLAQKSPQLKPCLLSPAQRAALTQQENTTPQQREKNEIIISNSGGGPCKQKVEVIETKLEDYFEDGLVNVSRALVARMRLVYPKMPNSSPLLDSLLSRRLSMPLSAASGKGVGEEGGPAEGEGGDSTVSSSSAADGEASVDSVAAAATIQEIPDSQRSATHRLRPAGHLLKEIRQHKLRYEALDESMGHYRCYYSECASAPGTCYSPLCRSKARYRDKLINSVKNYTIVTSKPSPFTQVGVYDVIRLSEMDFSEAAAAVEAKKKLNNNNNNNSSLNSFFASASNTVNCRTEEGDAGSKTSGDAAGKSGGEISVRLEADLDESSQESDTLEQKFGLNGSKEDVSNALTCRGKVYLRKANSSAGPKTKSSPRLPPLSNCGVGKDRYSVLVLPAWELKVLCRRWWRHSVSGFGHQAKSNPSVWPYQCPRPLFKQTWLYHTATLGSLSAVALQLRILWCCLRWDDMQEKGPSDGKRHITTDTEIVQTEVLKRKYSGRFSEKTEYLRRKVTIPLDVPKPVREFTPSQRSGLRKRRRAQSPEDKRPESMEEWIPEEQLLIWEIRLFGERLERAANLPKKSDSNASIASKITLSASVGSSFELKQRMEEQLKQQRSVFQQQQRDASGGGTARTMLKISSITSSADASKPSILTPIKAAPAGTNALSSITAAKKLVRTKDGRIISVQTLGSIQPGAASSNFTPVSTVLPKVHIATSQPQQQQQPGVVGNKVIRLQTVAANPRMILPRAPRPPTVVQTATPAPPPATVRLPNQNIQIIRLPDGQIQVKGLLDGQQMIQRADGKFQLINNKTTLPTTSVAPSPVVQVTQQPKPTVVLSNSHQLVKVNGQQVLLRKEGAQVVSVGAGEALKTAAVGGVFVNPQKPAIINSSIGQLKVTPDGSFVSSAPATVVTAPVVNTINTAPKTDGNSLTLKVQVRMTHQGPKTIIQGLLPTVGLTKDHIRAIQQQVRTMLAQYNLKVDQLSPIMTLTLQMNNSSTTTTQATAPLPVSVPNVIPQPQQQTVVKQLTSPTVRVSGPPSVKVPAVIALKNNTSTFIRTASGSIIPASAVSSASTDMKQPPVAAGAVGSTTANNAGGQFVLTSDYIQETIQSALSRNDLSPDVEEKLMQLKKYNSEQTPSDNQQQQQPIVSSTPLVTSTPITGKRTRDASEAGGTEGGKRSRGCKRARAGDAGRGASAARCPTNTTSTAGEDGTCPSSKKRRSGGSAATSPADDAKRKVTAIAKLESQLSRHKDLLKKDILKKRAFLEKDLQLQIHRELNVAKQELEVFEKKGAVSSSKCGDSSPKKKRKLSSSADVSWSAASASSTETVSSTTASSPPSQTPKKHKTSNNKKLKNKNKKIVCICRTPFDDTKFYVGCDLCANWYHGDCVGITEALSRTMNEYVCDDCANAKMNKELYCFCKQPYDETQFYICCEQCEDWYHGRCIGIMQGEADDIDDYICPKCQPNNVWNLPCQKKLTNKDYTELKKFTKTLVSHKNAWPFLDAVDPSQVPDYYKVVRQPMDLRTVERRVKDHHYNRLADFVGDIMLLLDNCRLYNPPNSSFVSCAATLESFCCSKLKLFKQKMTSQTPSHPH